MKLGLMLTERFSLLKELVKPCALREAGAGEPDGRLSAEQEAVWNALTDDLKRRCVHSVLEEKIRYSEFEKKREDVAEKLGKLCVPSLRGAFVEKLLTSLDLLDEFSKKGENGTTKLDTLFIGGDEARALQRSIVETCGISNFGVLHSKVADIVQNFNTEENTG